MNLSPCPFCGGKLLEKYHEIDGSKSRDMCGLCSAIGPKQGEIDTWNTRPLEAAARTAALEDAVQGIDAMKRHYTETKERVVNPSYALGVHDGMNVCRTAIKCIIEGIDHDKDLG